MTNPNTGKVPLTVWVDPPSNGVEWISVLERLDSEDKMVVVFRRRPIAPATVMVEMEPRDAEFLAELMYATTPQSQRIKAAARTALARKREPLCRNCKYPEEAHPLGDRARESWNVCSRFEPDRKPCPVMVCINLSSQFVKCHDGGASHPGRRPCKLEAGHGGEHE